MSTSKTVIVAPAIKIHFWQNLHRTLSKSEVPFHLVFVGHIEPDFNLPENFTYIKCDLSAAACAEIAYRYTYKHIKDAKYIMNMSDDMGVPDNLLADLIAFYDIQIKKYQNDFIVVGNMLLNSVFSENLMGLSNGKPCLLANAFTTVENSKKIGGIDSDFKSVYWDCDRYLRTQMTGGLVIFATVDEMKPTWEIEQNPGGLLDRYGGIDKVLLNKLWKCERTDNGLKIACCLNNRVVIDNFTLSRTRPVKEFLVEEVGKWYE